MIEEYNNITVRNDLIFMKTVKILADLISCDDCPISVCEERKGKDYSCNLIEHVIKEKKTKDKILACLVAHASCSGCPFSVDAYTCAHEKWDIRQCNENVLAWAKQKAFD